MPHATLWCNDGAGYRTAERDGCEGNAPAIPPRPVIHSAEPVADRREAPVALAKQRSNSACWRTFAIKRKDGNHESSGWNWPGHGASLGKVSEAGFG